MNTIYLFTSNFPFGKGESFIEDEVLTKINNNYQLVIVPFRDRGQKRTLPSNVELNMNLAKNFIVRFIKSACSLWVIKKIFSMRNSKQPPQNIRAFFSAVKYIIGANIIKQFISSLNLKEGDILYSYWLNHVPLGLVEGLHKSPLRSSITIVSRAHRYDIYEEDRNIYFPFKYETIKNLNRVFCISENGKNYLSEKYGLSSLMEVSHLGVWRQPNTKQRYPDNDVISFVSCSSLVPVKRVDKIFEYLNEYAKNTNKFIKWTHFGSGELYDNIITLINKKVSNLDIILKGHMPKQRIMEEYKSDKYDIFINLSSSEGIPVSIMEAISVGLPVIATNVGGTPEILNKGAGIGLDKNVEFTAFINAVNNILNQYERYSNNALNTFEKEYNAAINYKSFFDRLIEIQNPK